MAKFYSKSIWNILFFAVVLSFLWGAWWGFYNYEREHPRSPRGSVIRVLAELQYFSPAFIADLEKNFKFNLIVTEKPTTQELLREALSHFQDYDLMVVPSYTLKSFLIENLFAPLDSSISKQFGNISIDFQHLDFDPDNRFLVPLSWSITGFIVNTKAVTGLSESLPDLLQTKSLSLLSSPVELFSLVSKLKPVLKNWVETDQNDSISEALKEIKHKNVVFESDPRAQLKASAESKTANLAGGLLVAQIQQGRAAKLLSTGSPFRFFLPKERGTLRISYIGMSRAVHDKALVQNVIDILLKPAWNKKLVEQNEEGAVILSLNDSELPALQKPQFIREVPLSRVDLFVLHEALEPTWLQAVEKELPTAKPK